MGRHGFGRCIVSGLAALALIAPGAAWAQSSVLDPVTLSGTMTLSTCDAVGNEVQRPVTGYDVALQETTTGVNVQTDGNGGSYSVIMERDDGQSPPPSSNLSVQHYLRRSRDAVRGDQFEQPGLSDSVDDADPAHHRRHHG